jgi:hypothetical protein
MSGEGAGLIAQLSRQLPLNEVDSENGNLRCVCVCVGSVGGGVALD